MLAALITGLLLFQIYQIIANTNSLKNTKDIIGGLFAWQDLPQASHMTLGSITAHNKVGKLILANHCRRYYIKYRKMH